MIVTPPEVELRKRCHKCTICEHEYAEEEMIYDNFLRRWYCDECWGLLLLDIEDSLE